MSQATAEDQRAADDDAPARDGHEAERPLRRGEWRTLAVLGIPTFGLALAITTVTTYLPLLASSFAPSTIVTGLLIGAEGLVALFMPVLAGAWSDQLRTRIGGRLPFVLGAAPLLAVAIAALGFAASVKTAAIAIAVFFIGYYVAYEPYRALYPDLVDDEVAGRAQSTQAVFRRLGTALALVGGGLLFTLGRPLPFVVGGVVVLVTLAAFGAVALKDGPPEQGRSDDEGLGGRVRDLRALLAERAELRTFFAANALWELALGALKTFVVLFISVGLGFSISAAALIVGATALIVLAASPVSGKLADRFGAIRVMHVALWVYGVGLLVPFVTTATVALVAVLPIVAFGGGVIMTLPYAVLMPMMPESEHGALSGFYSLSRGVGTALGPLLAGVAIQLLKGTLASTQGYAAMWLVCSLAILASIPFLRRLRRARGHADDHWRGWRRRC
jgi:MFS family permease